ncbi:MAG: CotH kinase family protein [Crocinitomicaceae bacterium]
MRYSYSILLLIIFVSFQSCYKEELIYNAEVDKNFEIPFILRINGKACVYDHTEKSLRCSIDSSSINNFEPIVDFQLYSDISFEGNKLINGAKNNLGKIEFGKTYKIEVFSSNKHQELTLVFTNLPTVQIITKNSVFDEPKTTAKITVNYPELEKESDVEFIGIEYRGATSQKYPKKSFGFSVRGAKGLSQNIASSFFEFESANEWILDAMWVDKGRIRNKTAFEVWNKINQNEQQTVGSKLVELYINNNFQGLYAFNEKMNAERLSLNNQGAVLYKAVEWEGGATRFETYENNATINSYWSGWEQEYPDPRIEVNWNPLNELRALIVNGSNDQFVSRIESLINIDNCIDYYIFLNLISANDNTGKNTFLFKKNNQAKFEIIPWDLDGTFGILWNGNKVGHKLLLSNNLFDRLLAVKNFNFASKLKERWTFLRSDILSEIALKNGFATNFSPIQKSGILELENKKWATYIDLTAEKLYLLNWISSRLIFLDAYFDNL